MWDMAKNEIVKVRLSAEEKLVYETTAAAEGRTLSSWIRYVLMLAKTNGVPCTPEAKGGDSHAHVSRSRVRPVEAVAGAAHPQKTREEPRGHDPRTCRTYGCLQCAAAGVKNDKRGLK